MKMKCRFKRKFSHKQPEKRPSPTGNFNHVRFFHKRPWCFRGYVLKQVLWTICFKIFKDFTFWLPKLCVSAFQQSFQYSFSFIASLCLGWFVNLSDRPSLTPLAVMRPCHMHVESESEGRVESHMPGSLWFREAACQNKQWPSKGCKHLASPTAFWFLRDQKAMTKIIWQGYENWFWLRFLPETLSDRICAT